MPLPIKDRENIANNKYKNKSKNKINTETQGKNIGKSVTLHLLEKLKQNLTFEKLSWKFKKKKNPNKPDKIIGKDSSKGLLVLEL